MMQPTGSNCPRDEKVSQIKIQVPLPVPDGFNSAAYFADLKQIFLESYDEDLFFQMSVQGVGSHTWWLRGNVRLKERVHLKSARKRVKRILVSCHSRHILDPDLNTKFGDYLASKLKVTSDAEQLSGTSHCWTPASLREPSSASTVPATAAATSGQIVCGPSTRLGSGAPTWAFNRHSGSPHTCPGGCCPPVASLSSASPNYAGPSSMYPGVDSLPFGLLGIGGGRGLGAGNGDHLVRWSDWRPGRGSSNAGVAAAAGGPGRDSEAAGRISADQGGGGRGGLNADQGDAAGAGRDAGLGAPAMPATPRSGSLGTGRHRSTPPAATASESPASKRARPGEEPPARRGADAMARNRLDFGQPPPSAGGAGAETPAPAKGPDVGPTPAHPAPLAGSPETSSLAPLSRVLNYEPASAGDGAGAGAPDSEGANPPTTPPRPPERGRERDSDGTPSSALAPPRKRREGAGPPPAARQGLSFPAAAAAAGSAASELPAAGSGKWTGYSFDVRLDWRTPDNTKGVEATTAAVKHYIRCYALGHDKGCVVDALQDGKGITLKIGGIKEEIGGQNAASRIGKQIRNCLGMVGKRSKNGTVRQCYFSVRTYGYLAQHELQVLERIHAPKPLEGGFRLWFKRLPKPPGPPAPAPSTVTGAVSASAEQAMGDAPDTNSPAPAAVARALMADMANVCSDLQEPRSADELHSLVWDSLALLEVTASYLKGLFAASAGSGPAPPSPCAVPRCCVAGDSPRPCRARGTGRRGTCRGRRRGRRLDGPVPFTCARRGLRVRSGPSLSLCRAAVLRRR